MDERLRELNKKFKYTGERPIQGLCYAEHLVLSKEITLDASQI